MVKSYDESDEEKKQIKNGISLDLNLKYIINRI